MDAIWGLVFTAIAVFVGITLLLTFPQTRTWVGFGNTEPTGVPGWLAGLMGFTGEPAPAAE